MNCTGEDLKYLFNTCTDETIKSFFRNCEDIVNGKQFSDYTADEIKEFFINFKDKKEVKNFFQTCGERIVTCVFDDFLTLFNDFLDKLIFAVNTPNEHELDKILVNAIGKRVKCSNAALPSAYIVNQMLNWFKRRDEEHYWLTAKEAKDILNKKADELMALSKISAISID